MPKKLNVTKKKSVWIKFPLETGSTHDFTKKKLIY